MADPTPKAPPAKSVALVDQEGAVVTVPTTQARRAVAEGMRPASADELAAAHAHAEIRQAEEKYGGLKGGLLAAGAGLARGLTVGTGDELALGVTEAFEGRTAREHLRESLRGLQMAHPYVSTGSELVGAVAPLLASGGGAGAAEGAAAAARAGEGASAIREALGVAKAARGASEGGSVAEAIGSALARTEGTGLARGAGHVVHDGEFVEGLRGLRAAPETGEVLAHGGELAPHAYPALGEGGSALARSEGVAAADAAHALPGEGVAGYLGRGAERAIPDAEFEEIAAEAPHGMPGAGEPPRLGMGEPPAPGKNPPGLDFDLGPDTRGMPPQPTPGGSRIAAALRGVGFMPRAIGAAGDLAENAVGRLVGTGAESMGGRALQSAARIGARGAVENGIFDVGQQLSEDALGNHDSTGEKLVAAFGRGALFGGATAGLLGGAGSVAADGVGALFRRFAHGPGLADAAGEQAWRALDPLKKFSMKAERTAGGIAEVGKTMLAEGVIPADEALANSALKSEDLLARVTAAKERIGAQIGEILKSSTATVGAKDLFAPIHEIVRGVEGKAGFEPVVASLEQYRRSLAEKLGFTSATGRANTELRIPVQDLVTQRRALDELVYKESKALDPKLRVELLREVRGVMHRVELEAIDRAAVDGAPGAAELKTLNKKYQHLSIAEDAAKETQARSASNRQLSLSDNMAMMGQASAAIAAGHPLAALGAPLVGAAHKWARQHGNALAASALMKASRLQAAERIVADADTRIADGISGLFATRAAGARAARAGWRTLTAEKGETRAETYTKQAARIAAFAGDPEKLTDAVHAQLGDFGTHAPNANAAAGVTAARVTSYLQSVLPVALNANDPWAHLSKPRVSHSEIDRFEKASRGALDPLGVVDEMRHGDVSRDEIEAVKACYPQIYQQMQGEVLGHLMKATEPPPYLLRVKLGALFDVPADITLSQQMLAEITRALAPKHAKKGAPSGGGISNASVRLAGQLETETDRLEGGGTEAAA